MAEYSPGQHPNSIATRFSSENQPANKGRKKGTRSWDAVFRKVLNNKEFQKTYLKTLPAQWNDIIENTPAELMAAGFVMSVSKEVAKAVQEDKLLSKDVRDAIMQLNKLGFGDKVVVEPDESIFDKVNLNFNVIQSARTEDTLSDETE